MTLQVQETVAIFESGALVLTCLTLLHALSLSEGWVRSALSGSTALSLSEGCVLSVLSLAQAVLLKSCCGLFLGLIN